MKRTSALSLSITFVCLMTGCFTAPERSGQNLQTLPQQFSRENQNSTVEANAVWWRSFGRSDLNALQTSAFAGNLEIAQAWARLRQSEATARQAGASLYPQGNLTAGSERTWRNEGDTAANSYSAGVSISYEVDLWGKIRASRNAASARAGATADELQSTALTISASVANRWIEIIEAETRIALLQKQLEVNGTQLELIELRFRNSRANSLDVYQQRQTLARTRSSIPPAQTARATSLHALNLLLGRAATEPQSIDWQTAPNLPARPATGVPSDLLDQRPDVRAALLRIEAADWNVAEAKADRLPSVSLGLDGSDSSDVFEDLFDDWLAKFAGRIAAPLFDGGRRRFEVQKQQAALDEAIAGFRQTVLTAFREVEDALVLEDNNRAQLEALRAELELARKTLSEARNRYANGLSDYLNVTTALVTLQRIERDEISSVADLFKARIALHKALGGQLPELAL